MWTTIANFFGANIYAQHSVCLTADPAIMTLYVASDLSTWLAYFVLAGCLLIRRNRSFHLNSTATLMFGAFIGLCGLTHLTMTLTLFVGVYRLDVLMRAATAGVSVVTAYFFLVETLESNRVMAAMREVGP